MWKLKERDERKRTLDTRIYSVVRFATKAPPTSTLLKHSRRVSFPGNQVSSVNTITVTLIPIFTKRDCPRRRGLRPRTKLSMPFHTKPEGRRLAGEPPKLQGWPAHQDIRMVHSRTTAQESKPCLITHSRANLALTLTKLVLRTKDLIFMLLDGLEVFLDVCVMSWDSSNLQMAGGAHIYRSPSRTSHL